MKKRSNYFFAGLVFLALSFLNSSCKNDDNNQVTPAPSIVSLSPDIGVAGTEIILTGKNFGSEAEVTFGSRMATTTVMSNTEIKVDAPSGFNDTTVKVTVSIDDKISNEKLFTYKDIMPAITSLSPDSGKADDIITISGTNFGNDPSKVEVRFNITVAKNIVSITDTQIKVKAPEGFSAQTVLVKVVKSGLKSNILKFYYADTSPPSISSTTSTCFYHSKVVIKGNNFSPNKEDNIVKFGNKVATVTDASINSLTVITPDLGAATTADITVTKFGMVSNTQSISVDLNQNKVATYDWTTHTVRSGIIYKTGTFSLFGSKQRRIYILDVTLNSTNTLRIGFSSDNENTVDRCKSYGAIVGINGGYFTMSGTTEKNPYIRINGTTVQAGNTGVNPIFTNAVLTIKNNVASVSKVIGSGWSLNLEAAKIPFSEASDVIVCGPILLTSGEIEDIDMSNSHNYSQTSRTGLGVLEEGTRVMMVVIDSKGSVTGVSTLQLAKIMQALGCVNAMNFDGGGSSTMYVQGQGDNGRVNFPYGGTWMRPVESVIYVD